MTAVKFSFLWSSFIYVTIFKEKLSQLSADSILAFEKYILR